MADPIDPEVITAMRRFKRLLDERETATMMEMAQHWARLERGITGHLEGLVAEIAERQARGQIVTADMVRLSKRYQELQAQVRDQVAEYADWAAGKVAAEQRWMGKTGLDHAAALLRAGFPRAAFNVLPVEALKLMAGYVADGSPLRIYFTKMYPAAMQGIMDALMTGMARGWGPGKTARLMRDALGVAPRTAINSARTETLRVYREASLQQYRASGIVDGYIRVAAKSERTCLACLAKDGEWFPLSTTFEEHNQGRCVAPGTVVSGPSVEAFMARYYQGEVVRIRAASGKLVTVTPNHPVLTDRGWRAAHLIQKGDHVVSSAGEQWAAVGNYPDEYQIPTLVEDVPGTLGMKRLGVVPIAPEHFHGDGVQSGVGVVWADGLLGDRVQPAIDQPLLHQLIVGGMMDTALLAAKGDIAEMLELTRATAAGFLSYGDTPMVLFDRCARCQEPVSSDLIAPLDAVIGQPGLNSSARDAVGLGQSVFRVASQVSTSDLVIRQTELSFGSGGSLLPTDAVSLLFAAEDTPLLEDIRQALFGDVIPGCNGLTRFAGEIILDRVLDVDVSSYCGHVYNLQTKGEWYMANGIVTHNCRAIPAKQGQQYPGTQGLDWFLKQPESRQRLMLGPGRYEAWKANAFDLTDIAKLHIDPVWGNAWQERSLKDLLSSV